MFYLHQHPAPVIIYWQSNQLHFSEIGFLNDYDQ